MVARKRPTGKVRSRAASSPRARGGGAAAAKVASAKRVRIVRVALDPQGWSKGYFRHYFGVGAPLYAVTDADTGDDLGELHDRGVPAGWPLLRRLVNGYVRASNRGEVEAIVRGMVRGPIFVR